MIIVWVLGAVFLIVIALNIFQSSQQNNPKQTPAKPEKLLDNDGNELDREQMLKDMAEGRRPVPLGFERSMVEKVMNVERKLRTDGLYHTIWTGSDAGTGKRVTYTWLLAFMPSKRVVKMKRDGAFRLTKEMLAEIQSTRAGFTEVGLDETGPDFCFYQRNGNNFTARFHYITGENDCYIEFDGQVEFDKLKLALNQYQTIYYGPEEGVKKKVLIDNLTFDFYKFPE
jgi:hypothetical protein